MEKQTARLEAFSDGIFGVAITLLAIEIGIREYEGASNANLWLKIKEKWPEYFTYFNSFATVLLIWMGHHKILRHVRVASHKIFLLNGLVLLFVVLFPFPTRMVGSFIGSEAENAAVCFYAGFTGFITLSMWLLNLGLTRNPKLLMHPATSLPWFKTMMRQQLVGFALYEIAAVIALYNYAIALGITFFMWVYWAFATKDTEEELK